MYLVFTSIFILTFDYIGIILNGLEILVHVYIFPLYNCLTKI